MTEQVRKSGVKSRKSGVKSCNITFEIGTDRRIGDDLAASQCCSSRIALGMDIHNVGSSLAQCRVKSCINTLIPALLPAWCGPPKLAVAEVFTTSPRETTSTCYLRDRGKRGWSTQPQKPRASRAT